MWYDTLDVNHDGVVSSEDAYTTRTRYSNAHHLTDETTQIQNWWDECVLKGDDEYASVDEFVEVLSDEYREKGSEKFTSMMKACFDTVMSLYDTNGNGFFNYGEFQGLYLAFGHDRIANNIETFKAFNPEAGKVPVRTIADAWAAFVTKETSSRVKNEFIKCGYS